MKTDDRLGMTALWAACGLLAAVPLFLPIVNPDLFWHLSAGRWMLEHRALPHADFLSFSAAGKPWIDFEWLSQLVFQLAYDRGGMTALWLLKAALLAAIWRLQDLTLARRGCGQVLRAWGLVLYAGGMTAYSDIRPELFSLLLLSLLVRAGESGLLQKPTPRTLFGVAAVFALWTNLHAGFPIGWFLLFCYAVSGKSGWERWRPLLLAVPATLLNPYGAGPWRVILQHWTQGQNISRTIREWQGLGFANPVYWPIWALIGFVVVAAALAVRASVRGRISRRPPWPLAAATLCLALATLQHERSCPYFAICAAILLPLLLHDLDWEGSAWARRSIGACSASCALFLAWLAPKVHWTADFNYKFVPRAAAGFMARQRPALEPLRLYNQWEWGGYLCWRLRPWYRAFWDGRYIFHEDLAAAERAIRDPSDWREFMSDRRLDGALLPDLASMLPARKRYPDGSLKDFPRPWYFFYMPKDQWALVYWDGQALLFVARRAVPSAWLAEHEYRYARPHDEAARKEALRLREIPAAASAAEDERHRSELAGSGAGGP